LLDETHLGLFTHADMVDLFERARFGVTDLRVVPGPGYQEWQALGSQGEIRVGRLDIADIPAAEAEEFFAYQYLIVASPREVFEAGRTATVEVRDWAANVTSTVGVRGGSETPSRGNCLRIAFLGNFEQAWSTETYAADALEDVGYAVHRIHEYGVATAAEVLGRIEEFQADYFLFFKGRIGEARALAEKLRRETPLRVEALLLRSRVALAQGLPDDARRWLDLALSEDPHDLEVVRWACQVLFEHGTTDEAERALRRLIDRSPDDASAHHNLGTLLLRTKRYNQAAESYRLAVRLRPSNPATCLHLGYTLKGQSRITEAEAAWQKVLKISPDDPATREELARIGRRPWR
jgi:tetratricopeptide (TPR) repeat protein